MLNRRIFVTALSSLVATVTGWRPSWGQTAAQTKLTLILTNDIYIMGDQVLADGKPRGGFARLATVVKQERAKGGNVIFAHGGDTLSPSPLSGFDQGAHIIELTNMIRPDIFVAGNHEFDFGKAVFLKRMSEASFPLYGANLRDADGKPLPNHKDRAMFTFDGVKVGLTGLAYDHSPRMSSPEDLKFESTVDVTKAQGRELRKDGADFTIGVLHCDRGDAIKLQFDRATDILLTGHTHDLYYNYDGENIITESGYDGFFITILDLDISVREHDGERRTRWWPKVRMIDSADVVPDPEVAAAVAVLQSKFTSQMDVPVGRTAVELDSRNGVVRTREAAIGNLFADAMRITTRSNCAVINGGGIRSGKIYPRDSEITRKDIFAELPFNNKVVVVEMTGRALKASIENGLSRLPEATGRFPQVSGMHVEFQVSRPPGNRIIKMSVAGAPLDENRVYRVAILDFLARGGDSYTEFAEAKRITPDKDAPLLATEVMNYIAKLGTVRVGVEGRMVSS
ncbi:trifunctional nucleotide phosphoesterase protein YfkN precursor [Variibacter gotjawalensis]|uniref:Trifunctional nucleotide phosphoesterase protein YfkN n=1 Tax=Variibacter gotjawalensis TaxID=1333996 RepID=A0A0S3PVN4_9BRAD|nr:bifunctional UDP-sugar hydrolase/5'-nucleotidase [Variibacter gotjawalensis]NIK45792.1 2',3'-cyclic-nucleotide 2'-phosphodiesterase (5'-nucleotidase family) [Variibacter gotjawalensis]RZS47716.1 2',3'-cyclic-nucleotide 2'-phosphodiesterase (5'-nucleotidase family) [Variibacter gotjawalensis]BAT59970.1 trifunctional nucleotide phosphoesterase protein YfkN precursor [Variibacter gotjawalensis]